MTSEAAYVAAIRGFSQAVRESTAATSAAAFLFGSAARERALIPGWSDIDVAVVVELVSLVDKRLLRQFLQNIAESDNIGFSILLVGMDEYESRFEILSPANSLLLNAASGRPGCGKVVYGALDFSEAPVDAEIRNAICYVRHTIHQTRRLLLEPKGGRNKVVLAQLIRWVSSIIRALLRTRKIFTFPYADALNSLTEIMPLSASDLLCEAFELRHHWIDVDETVAGQFIFKLDGAFEEIASKFESICRREGYRFL